RLLICEKAHCSGKRRSAMNILLFAQDNTAINIFSGMAFLMIVIWVLAILANVFWLWMLIDALVNERRTEDKILWFLVIFLLHFVGALVYLFVRRSGQTRAAP